MGYESPDERANRGYFAIFRRKIFIKFNHNILIYFYILRINANKFCYIFILSNLFPSRVKMTFN